MLPSINSGYRPYQGHVQLSKNMAYLNVSSEGAQPSGPFLKRAEKDLIMRRGGYKQHLIHNDVNRMAMVYGSQNHGYNSHERQFLENGVYGPRSYLYNGQGSY